MQTLEKEVFKLLHGRLPSYSNYNEVEFTPYESYGISLCSVMPGLLDPQTDCTLELFESFESISWFLNVMDIKNITDLNHISAGHMYHSFLEGSAVLWSYLYPGEYILTFRKKGGNFVVTDINNDLNHVTSSPLKSNEDFRNYAKYYFSA